MGSIRRDKLTSNLYLTFTYKGKRCKEPTSFGDTPQNRDLLRAFLNRIESEIARDEFDYIKQFPDSKMARRMAGHAPPGEEEPIVKQVDFGSYAEKWFIKKQRDWRVTQTASVRTALDKYLLPHFGPQRISSITRRQAIAFQASLEKHTNFKSQPLSGGRVNKVVGFLQQIIRDASVELRFKYQLGTIKRLPEKGTDVDPFTLDEVEMLIDAVQDRFRNYLSVRFFTGMRSGEINALKWKQIDFRKGLIKVRDVIRGGVIQPGNYSASRDVPFIGPVRAVMEAQYRLTGGAGREESFVFTNTKGGALDSHNFAKRVWNPLLQLCGFEQRNAYQTRHTAAVLLLQAGENPEWVARILGLKSTEMIFRSYDKYIPDSTRKGGKAFSEMLDDKGFQMVRHELAS
jgi:integrase